MNAIDKQFFQQLYEDRAQSADTFEKPSTRQMWHSIVEKYSDQAHFVYELIQNADDAGATYARFILEKDNLKRGARVQFKVIEGRPIIIWHNGFNA